jgi:site-specific recombinase XerD
LMVRRTTRGLRDLVKHAKPCRDRLIFQVAYFGGLRVFELVSYGATARGAAVFIGKGSWAEFRRPALSRSYPARQ